MQSCVIDREDAFSPAFRIRHDERTLFLSADSTQLATDWITGRFFQNLLVLTTSEKMFVLALQTVGARATSGWAVLIIAGESKRVWMHLSNEKLEFYKDEITQVGHNNFCFDIVNYFFSNCVVLTLFVIKFFNAIVCNSFFSLNSVKIVIKKKSQQTVAFAGSDVHSNLMPMSKLLCR